MLCIYESVIDARLSNVMGANVKRHGCPVPNNTSHKAWAELAVTPDNERAVSFLIYSFLAGYEGPVPSPLQKTMPQPELNP